MTAMTLMRTKTMTAMTLMRTKTMTEMTLMTEMMLLGLMTEQSRESSQHEIPARQA